MALQRLKLHFQRKTSLQLFPFPPQFLPFPERRKMGKFEPCIYACQVSTVDVITLPTTVDTWWGCAKYLQTGSIHFFSKYTIGTKFTADTCTVLGVIMQIHSSPKNT